MRLALTVVLVLVCTAALIGSTNTTGAKGTPAAVAQPSTPTKATPRCPSARSGLVFYRVRYSGHRRVRGVATPWPAGRKPRNCADAHYLAEEVWPARAFQARQATERWLEKQLPDVASWTHAVRIVQRVFPGTESWLLSCSDAEGYNRGDPTRWVVYGGRPYYPGAEHDHNGSLDQVGGPMQFMWGTFRGMYRHGLEHVRSKGFFVPAHLSDPGDVLAWRSMIAQAIAAGWARYTGNDNSHWSASWNNGC